MTTRGQRVALVIWTAAFLIGVFNHARSIVAGGWLPYVFAPMACNVFWTALLPIDLIVAALLWVRRAAGIWAGLAVMIADVLVNSWFAHTAGFPALTFALQMQTLFLGFAIGSAGWLLRQKDSY